uniref:Corticotropin-releasing factor-binding protein n=1 Tax=Eurytemora pacifica TaxID=207948 RepID=A0A2U9Q5H7_9MAXI|nr:corticotropin-releasing hormone-binding protein [Eurytemora pacifica]
MLVVLLLATVSLPPCFCFSSSFPNQRYFPGFNPALRTNSEPTLADLQVSGPLLATRQSSFLPRYFKKSVFKPRAFPGLNSYKRKRGFSQGTVHKPQAKQYSPVHETKRYSPSHQPKTKRYNPVQEPVEADWSNLPHIEQIIDCMTVETITDGSETIWFFKSKGEAETCGLYIVGEPDSLVEATVDKLDVDCSNGLIMVFNGWELNGNIFPSSEDHQLPLKERSATFCNQETPPTKVVVSSQNAALVSYKIPTPGEGFSVRVKTIRNPDPCNILMSSLNGYFTLQNHGIARNCSLTTLLFPANFALLSLDVGEPYRAKRSQDSGLQTQCSLHGWSDYIELGGSMELDSTNLVTSETICGFDAKPIEKGLTVLCGSSTVRLVSSGNFENSVSVYIKAAEDEDLDFNTNHVISCPEH